MSRSRSDLGRRHVLVLAGLAAAGVGAAWLLRRAVPIGRDVGTSPVARDLLADRTVPALGAADGDLTMAVFTDYRCPACRSAYPGMMAAITADGRVKLLVYDWPIFGEPSRRTARIALAAARQGQYGAVHDRLMTDPRAMDEAALPAIVTEAGVDWDRVQTDLATYAGAIDGRLSDNARRAVTLGLPGTPAYLIGPLLAVGMLGQPEFTRAFGEARSRSRPPAQRV